MDRGEHWRKNHYTFGTTCRFYSNGRGYFTKEESSECSAESEVNSFKNEHNESYNDSEIITLSYKSSFSSDDSTGADHGYLSLLKSTYGSEVTSAQNKTNPTLVDNSFLAEFDPYYVPLVDVSSSASPITFNEKVSNVEELSDLTNEEECDIYEQKLSTMKYIMESKEKIYF